MASEEKGLSIPAGRETEIIQRMECTMGQMTLLMQSMADTIRATNERMTILEKVVRQMTPVTASQAEAISQAIKDRALELLSKAGLDRNPDAVREVAGLIRKAVRLAAGIRGIRDLPRVEFYVTVERIGCWDDYKQLRAVREKYRREG